MTTYTQLLRQEWGSCSCCGHNTQPSGRQCEAVCDRMQGRVGHSSVETTQVYTKMVDRITENPTKYLEELMG